MDRQPVLMLQLHGPAEIPKGPGVYLCLVRRWNGMAAQEHKGERAQWELVRYGNGSFAACGVTVWAGAWNIQRGHDYGDEARLEGWAELPPVTPP